MVLHWMRYAALAALVLGAPLSEAQTAWYWHSSPAGNDANKSWNWTALPNGGGVRPPTPGDDNFSDTTLGPWTFIDSVAGKVPSGQPASAVSMTGGKLSITAAGSDVWVGENQFAAVYRNAVTGALDVSVKIESQTEADVWSKAGIMLWNDYRNFAKGGGFAVEVTPKSGFVVHVDSVDHVWDGSGTTAPGRFDFPTGPNNVDAPSKYPCWLRAVKRKVGDEWVFTGYYRTDSTQPWIKIRGDYRSQRTSDSAQMGLFVSSHNTSLASTVVFDDFEAGGDLGNTAYDFRFNGTGTGAAGAAVLSGHLGAKSVDFTGYAGAFSFGGWGLTLSGNAVFSQGMAINPGTGALVFAGPGAQTLAAKANDTLPRIIKSGTGTLTVGSNPLVADSLQITGGVVDLGDRHAWLRGFGSTGGALQGFGGGNDTLTIAGHADFSGLTALDMDTGGTVVVFARGSGRTVTFAPGPRTFRHLVLRTEATGTGDARITVAGGLNVAGNLHFRGLWGAKDADGIVSFRGHGGTVIVGGDVIQSFAGTPSPVNDRNWHPVFMGDRTWRVGGNVSLSLRGGGADKSTLELTGTGLQVLTVADSSLYAVRHASAGTLRLGAALRAHSLEQSGRGILDLNAKGLRLAGDLSVTGGSSSLSGLADTLSVGGDATFKGTGGDTLSLSSLSRWHLRVKGSLSADSAFIGNSDARGGSAGQATAACVDRGLNFNWSFAGGKPTAPPAVTRDPVADTSVVAGQRVTLSAGVDGHAPFAWQWRKRGDTAVVSTDSLLVLDSAAFADSGYYRVIVSNSTGKDTSAEARLRVLPPPVGALVLRNPSDTTVKAGGRATFSLSVAGTRPIQYAWFRTGSADTVSKDSVLVISPVAASHDGAAYYCIVSNLGGAARDTSGEGRILVRSCDTPTIQVSPDSLTVDEGKVFTLGSRATCADGHGWKVVSGPSPRLHDPGADTLSFTAPRVGGDTAIRYQYSAYLGETVKSRDVVVRIKEAIPDPAFALPAKVGWNGLNPLVVKPAISNKARLDLFPAHPVVYAWSVQPLTADSAAGGDSLTLKDPLEDGLMEIELCLDNGGARSCDTSVVEVKRVPSGLLAGALRLPGDMLLAGRTVYFTRPGRVRLVDFRGRVLFEARAAAGESREMTEDARRAFAGRRARLMFDP